MRRPSGFNAMVTDMFENDLYSTCFVEQGYNNHERKRLRRADRIHRRGRDAEFRTSGFEAERPRSALSER
jgi:hypothetical protein